MAADEPVTPEKQLLKIIESPKAEPLQTANIKRKGRVLFSLGALKGRLAFLKSFSFQKWSSFRQASQTSMGIHHVNLALKFLILFLAVYLGYSVYVMAVELKKASNLIFEYDKTILPAPELVTSLKDLPYYLEKVTSRDLFNVVSVSPQEPEQTVVEIEPQDKRIKKYSLVGIAWSDNPEVMIENTEAKKTHFVHRGQLIDDDVKIVAIFKDAVILSQDGKEFELR